MSIVKKILLAAFCVGFGFLAVAQSPIPLKSLQTAVNKPGTEGDNARQVGVTDGNGKQRYVAYTDVLVSPIGYSPAATGNTINLSRFVQRNDSIWYIDFEGDSKLLKVPGGGAVNDADWLKVRNNGVPYAITDTIYTLKTVSINGRNFFPDVELNVFDSTSVFGSTIGSFGNRGGRFAGYNTLTGAWSSFGQEGSIAQVYGGAGTTHFSISELTGTAPGSPSGTFEQHFEVDFVNNNLKVNKYPNTRDDSGAPVNILNTDASGILRSDPVSSLVEAVGVDTIKDYAALRLYTGAAKVLFVQNSTYTFNGSSWTTIGGTFRRVPSGTENGGTLIAAANGIKWARDWDLVHVQPEWWVVGGYNESGVAFTSKNVAGGINNEIQRINAACAVAGTGSHLVLFPSKTYLLDGAIDMKPGQTISGNNATLKRQNAINVTLSAGAAGGATIITVNDATPLRVGQNLLILKGLGGIGNTGYAFGENVGATTGLIITGISGNNVTLVNALPEAVTSGWRVIINHDLIGSTHGLDNKLYTIKDINFDGNKGNNGYTVDWRVVNMLHCTNTSLQGVIDNCFFFDSPSENVTATKINIKNSRYLNLNGSFIHITAAANSPSIVTVENCSGTGSNKAGNAAMNHSEALFTSSAFSSKVRIIGGNFEDGNEAVLSATTADDFDWAVSNANFNNFKVVGSIGTATKVLKNFRINNNTFYNCGPVSITSSGSLYQNTALSNVTINDNTFWNARLEVASAGYIVVKDNFFLWNDTLTTKYDYSTNVLNAQNAFFHFINFDRLHIVNNIIELPKTYAAHIRNALMLQHNDVVRKTSVGAATEYLYSQDVKVVGNSIFNAQYGICNVNTTAPQNVSVVVEAVGWEYKDNIIYMQRTSGASNGTGIYIHPGVRAEGNTVYTNTTAQAFCGILVKGIGATGSANIRLHGGYCNNNKVFSCTGSTVADILVGTEGSTHFNQTITNNETRDDILAYGTFSGYMSGNYKRTTINYPTLSAETCPFYQGFGENANQY